MVSRPYLTHLLIGLSLLASVSLASAQPDVPTESSISEGAPVVDTITDVATFDIFEFSAVAGEQFRADMQASGGLAPLVGLRNPGGDVISASDQLEDGSTLDAEPDGLATVFFEIMADGTYALVATRVGHNEGTTVGSYTLTLTRVASAPDPDNTYTDVTFRCAAESVTTALVIEFGDQSEGGESYVVTVYGFNGFDPVIRLGGDDGTNNAPCETAESPDNAPALEFGFGGETESFSGEAISGVAVFTLTETANKVRITVGSRDGAPGRYALHVTGLEIETAGDGDLLTFRNGPRAKAEPVTVWMLRDGLSRLDPHIEAPEGMVVCADVALRTCDSELSGATARLTYGPVDVATTDRLDSAASLDSGTSDPVELSAASQNGRTIGAYTLFIFGTLPDAQ